MAIKRPGTYVPLSTDYYDDAAIIAAGEDAELLFVRMLAYASRHPSWEGVIPAAIVEHRLGIRTRECGNGCGNGCGTDALSRVGKLCEQGLVERVDDGYRIVSWLKWNRSADEVERRRAADRKRKQASDKRKHTTGSGNGCGNKSGNGSGLTAVSNPPDTDTDTDRETNVSLIGPVGETRAVDNSEAKAPSSRQRKGTRLPDGWTPTRTPGNQKAEQGHDQAWLDRELERFRDYWSAVSGQRGRKLDWDATWRNWLRNAEDRAQRQPGFGQARTAGSLTEDDWEAMLAEAERRDALDARRAS